MEVYNFGSLNIDHVYSVDHFVQPGETMSSDHYQVCCGGKGLNQSIAVARAKGSIHHLGVYGQGGEFLLEYLQNNGVDTSLMNKTETAQGHTVIQVSKTGENCIILYPGSNYEVTQKYIDDVLDQIKEPGYLLLQNEISEVPYIIHEAAKRGHQIVFNASPFSKSLKELDFNDIAWLMINEVEGYEFTGCKEPEGIIAYLSEHYPHLGVVLTLGSAGCIVVKDNERVEHGIYHVPVVDTTAAGDTFTGYFAAALAEGKDLAYAVDVASAASALAVTKSGAAPSIPMKEEAEKLIQKTDH